MFTILLKFGDYWCLEALMSTDCLFVVGFKLFVWFIC